MTSLQLLVLFLAVMTTSADHLPTLAGDCGGNNTFHSAPPDAPGFGEEMLLEIVALAAPIDAEEIGICL